MMIGPCFDGDDDKDLMTLQHDCYGASISLMANTAAESYRKAWSMLGRSGDKLGWPFSSEGFDHRVIQRAHDLMAANFRHWNAGSVTKEQPELGVGDKQRLEYLGERWQSALEDQCKDMAWEKGFVMNLLLAIEYQNKPEGLAAEKALYEFLLERLGARDWLTARGWLDPNIGQNKD